MQVVKAWFGALALEDGKLVECELFPGDGLVERFLMESTPEEQKLLDKHSAEIAQASDALPLCSMAMEAGLASSEEEYQEMLHRFSADLAEVQLKKSVSRDNLIIQAVETLDDINKSLNILNERAAHWTSLQDSETFNEQDDDAMQKLLSTISGLEEQKSSLEEYVKQNMETAAPNLSNLAGVSLGARLISIAGSLEKLSKMPASTIQVLGASDALFKHLSRNIPPPKHGAIFMHPIVHDAPWWQRGKMARVLASKLTIAARIDYYSGDLREELAGELETAAERIKKRFSKPPDRKGDTS